MLNSCPCPSTSFLYAIVKLKMQSFEIFSLLLLQQRRQHQAELARQKNEETARRLASGGLGSGDGQGPNRTTGDITAYRSVDDIPARELKIHVCSEFPTFALG